jgi:hypothetical protein
MHTPVCVHALKPKPPCWYWQFVGLYKRPGKRVLVNNLGDLVLDPTYLENNVLNRPGASAMDHYMEYARHGDGVINARTCMWWRCL